MNKTLITAKTNPDLDGVACMYAYAEYLRGVGEDAVAGVFGEAHVEAKYLLDRFSVNDLPANPAGPFDNFILVDMSEAKGLPDVVVLDRITEVIDHRSFGQGKETFPNAKIQNEPVGAAATLIAEKYFSAPFKISANSALLLAGAIYSNTLNFKGGVTTDRDHKALEWLKSQIAIPGQLVHEMFAAKTKSVVGDLETVVRSDFKSMNDIKGKKIGIAQLEIINLEEIITTNLTRILNLLKQLKQELALDHIFLTVPDLEKGFNLIVTDDLNYQKILSEALGVSFTNSLAKTDHLLMRKEIIPMLRK